MSYITEIYTSGKEMNRNGKHQTQLFALSNWGKGAQFYNESDVFNYSLVIVLFCMSFVLKKSGKISFGFT